MLQIQESLTGDGLYFRFICLSFLDYYSGKCTYSQEPGIWL